eukprot:GHVP01031449.1.p1 GENE.GHVP01031449.1~~GHVP01031449.1.p1  ORF type:complete len:182 (-),score=31.84 GHVP01031449.1:407-952(-)
MIPSNDEKKLEHMFQQVDLERSKNGGLELEDPKKRIYKRRYNPLRMCGVLKADNDHCCNTLFCHQHTYNQKVDVAGRPEDFKALYEEEEKIRNKRKENRAKKTKNPSNKRIRLKLFFDCFPLNDEELINTCVAKMNSNKMISMINQPKISIIPQQESLFQEFLIQTMKKLIYSRHKNGHSR